MFADDTTIYCSHENDNYPYQIIEQDITSLTDWFNANKFSLNLLKTVSMSFDNNKKIKLNIKIDCILIPQVENFKFLGLTIDNKLEWNQHFTLLFNKILINQGMLSLNTKLLNTHMKKLIYYAHIYSHISYCILIWGGAISNQNFLKLSKLQNSCIRMIKNSNKRAHIKPIYKSLYLLTIDQILTLELQKFGHKLYHNN